jgi:hypothetical protein
MTSNSVSDLNHPFQGSCLMFRPIQTAPVCQPVKSTLGTTHTPYPSEMKESLLYLRRMLADSGMKHGRNDPVRLMI